MNTTFHGTLFDGETLAPRTLALEAADGRIRSRTDGVAVDVAIADLRLSDRLASLPRFLYLPDGRTIETMDNDLIDLLLSQQARGRIVATVHWLEARTRVAATATVLLVAIVAAAVWWGLPALARKAAMAVPPTIERQAGQAALATLNRMLAPSQLQKTGQARVSAQLDRLLQARPLPTQPEVVFRSMGGTYPNAFALPGGFIVVSDELVALANDEELAAVLAHEIAHWQLRHGLQGVLRGSAALLLVSTITGDLSTLTTFAGTIPFALLQNGYSREFEEAADAYAVELLQKAGISPVHFVRILQKLEDARPDKGQDFTYLSTHPTTADRIRRIDPEGNAKVAAPAPASESTGLPPSAEHEIITLDGPGDTRPKPLEQTAPTYPPLMATLNASGKVSVEFIIDKNGDVRDPRVIKSSHREFEPAAIDAVLKWKFAPGRKNGRAVATRVSQLIEFNLQDPAPDVGPAESPVESDSPPKP